MVQYYLRNHTYLLNLIYMYKYILKLKSKDYILEK